MVTGDKNGPLGRAPRLASRRQRRPHPHRDGREHSAAGGRGVKRKLVRREGAGATDGPGSWMEAPRGRPGRTTPFGEAPLDAYAATIHRKENGNGYPAEGLCALAGQRPRWVKIFSMTSG